MYKLNIDEAVREIKEFKAKKVLIQLPDGLKPKAKEITDELEEKTDADILIWAGSCFGACDIPKVDDVDLLMQWGHSKFKRKF